MFQLRWTKCCMCCMYYLGFALRFIITNQITANFVESCTVNAVFEAKGFNVSFRIYGWVSCRLNSDDCGNAHELYLETKGILNKVCMLMKQINKRGSFGPHSRSPEITWLIQRQINIYYFVFVGGITQIIPIVVIGLVSSYGFYAI